MSAKTDALENLLVDHIFRAATWSKPASVNIALYTAAPGETGGGTEVSGGSYARVQHGPADADWKGTHGTTTGASSGTSGQVSNASVITFATPSANWGSVVAIGIFAATTLYYYGNLTTAKTVNNGDAAPTFPTDALTVTEA